MRLIDILFESCLYFRYTLIEAAASYYLSLTLTTKIHLKVNRSFSDHKYLFVLHLLFATNWDLNTHMVLDLSLRMVIMPSILIKD